MFTLMFLVIFKDIFPTKRSSHITVMFQISKSKKVQYINHFELDNTFEDQSII